MKKGFFNAILFGGMIALSAGTFVACSDYDDDIDNLQEQINSVNSTLTSLQTEVRAGKWISSLTPTTNGFTVVFSDGTTYTIQNGTNGTNGTNGINGTNGKDGAKGETGATGAAGKDGTNGTNGKDGTQITIGTDGYWYLDGVKSEYKATASTSSEDVKVPYVGEDGFWYFYENGEAVKSNYKANGAAYAVKGTDGVWTLSVPDASGTIQAIKLPTAASKISGIEFYGTGLNLNLTYAAFNFDGSAISSTYKWPSSVPADGTAIVASVGSVLAQVSPSDAADDILDKFTLQDSKLNTLGVKLTVKSYDGLVTRSAANGMYQITVDPQTLSKTDYEALKEFAEDNDQKEAGYAVVADGVFRSAYKIEVSSVSETPTDLAAPSVSGLDGGQIVVNQKNTIKFVNNPGTSNEEDTESSLYDMYFEFDKTIQDAYGIVYDNKAHTFTVTKNPDAASTSDDIEFKVYYLDINGDAKVESFSYELSSKIGESTLAEQTVDLSAKKPQFGFNLADANINSSTQWKLQVNSVAYNLYSDKKLTTEVTGVTLDAAGTGLFTTILANATSEDNLTTSLNTATRVIVKVNEKESEAANLKLNTTYYLKVTFSGTSGELNNAVLPVKFTAPSLSKAFAVKSGYLVDGVINAYFAGSAAEINLADYFSSYDANAVAAGGLDNKTAIAKKLTSDQLAEIISGKLTLKTADATPADGTTAVKTDRDHNDGFELGYGKDLIVNASKDNYKGWKYTEDSEKAYSFKIKVMSPIMEGSIASATSSTISISAGDDANPSKITSSMIKGYDYNKNAYNIVPDVVGSGADRWSKAAIADVTVSADKDGYITTYGVVDAEANPLTGAKVADGYIEIAAAGLSNTETVDLPITVEDTWGYTKTFLVKVTITKN